MDNANEIAEIQRESDFTHKEVALFLGDELKAQNNEAVVTYDLTEEYAKTAKHKKLFVWILLGLCFFIVGAGTFTTIGLVSNSNHKIKINIDSFDDLNLRSLLSSAGRVKNLYEAAIKNKANLEESLADELNQAEQKRENDLFTLQSVSSVATKDSISERKIKIELDYNTAVQKLHELYDSRIGDAESEVQKYKNQVSSYDAASLDADASLDSTKQLHDLEMKNQAERYETKIRELRKQLLEQQRKAAEEQREAVEEVQRIYQAKIDLLDPKAREQSSEQNKIILDAGIKNQTENSTLWQSVENLTFNENNYTSVLSNSQFAETVRKVEKELSELRTIAYRFKPIPMENSIKDYVPAMMHQSYQIADYLAETGSKMQAELDGFYEITEQNLQGSGSDGVILGKNGEKKFVAYVLNASRFKVPEEEGEGEESVPVQILSNGRLAAEGTISKQGGEFIVTQKLPDAQEGSPASITYAPVAGDRIRIVQQQQVQ